ncbi:MAG TPA: NfeD family protein [Thermoanaerobaculia bacterium]|nr:NfeD family protein [Thermoanaerobaculia bacterium]
MLTLAYMAFAALGCLYVVVAAFLGHVSDFGTAHSAGHGGHADGVGHGGHWGFGGHGAGKGVAADGGHVAADAYGVGGTGHGAVSAGAPGVPAFHFPFFSPLALATLVAALGAYGLIAKIGLKVGDEASLAIALPAALATAYGIAYLGWRLVSGSRGSSMIRVAELAGAPAEVTTPIPAGGMGEAVAMVGGQRYAAPAREAGGGELPRGAAVTVVSMVGSTLVVRAGDGRRQATGDRDG